MSSIRFGARVSTVLLTHSYVSSVSGGGVHSDLFCADGLQVQTSVQ